MFNFNRLELDPSGLDRTPKQTAALSLVRIAERVISKPVMSPLEKAETRALLETARVYLVDAGSLARKVENGS